MQSGDNNTASIPDCLQQIRRVFLLVNVDDTSQRVVKTTDSVLQLRIQYGTVGDDKNRGENRFAIFIVKAGQPISRPGNTVRLAGTGAVLNQIIVARAVLFNLSNQLSYHVQLMITGKNNFPGKNLPGASIFLPYLLAGNLIADKFLDNIQQFIFLQNLIPQIRSHVITIRGRRVAGTAILARSVAALVKWQEVSFLSIQLGSNRSIVQVYGKESKDAAVQFEAVFSWVTVVHPLHLGIVDGLTRQLILQFKRDDGNAVDGQHHIHTVFVVVGIVPLPDTLADILLIVLVDGSVQRRFRLEIADTEFHTTITETMPQHRNQAVSVNGILKCFIEFLLRLTFALTQKALPCNRLRNLHKLQKCF